MKQLITDYESQGRASSFQPGRPIEDRSIGAPAVLTERPPQQPAIMPVLPFTVTIAETTPSVKLAVTKGYYENFPMNTWTEIAATAATAGNKAYLVLEQDSNRAITSATVLVTTDDLDAVVIDGSNATSNVLLAEATTAGSPPVSTIRQHRNGNLTIGLWQINGSIVRWPETVGGAV